MSNELITRNGFISRDTSSIIGNLNVTGSSTFTGSISGSSLSANTISASTITGGIFYGGGSNLTFVKETFFKSVGTNIQTGFSTKVTDYIINSGASISVHINGVVPSDFFTLISAEVILLPDFTQTGITITYENRYSNSFNSFESTIISGTTIVDCTQGELILDSINVFSGISADNIFNFKVYTQDGGDIYISGMRMNYSTS